MKLKNRVMPAILFCGVVALSSCEKNEQEAVNPEFKQEMLSQVMLDSSKVTSYTFAGTQLSQINHHNPESGALESFEKYERNSNGKITKASTYAAGNQDLLAAQTYTYNADGLLTRTDMAYYQGGQLNYTAYATYAYDEQKNLLKKSLYEVHNDGKDDTAEVNATQKSYTTYSVLPNGNYAEEKQYVLNDKGEASLFSTTTYSYDSNPNPMHAFAEPGSACSQNNVIASSAVVHNGDKTFKYAYTYTYSERGYPLTQTVVTPTGKNESYNYVYSN